MPDTRDSIAAEVRANLADAGVTYYSATDINSSIQDAYDDVASFTGCIQKIATVPFSNQLVYYDMLNLVPDFFAVVAIRNNVSNRWMDADSLKGFDTIRWDWELWEGQPLFYAPINFRYIAIIPWLADATGASFNLYYRATAPVLAGDDTPLVHVTAMELLETYATADLLDQAQEYKKSDEYFDDYTNGVIAYKSRVGKLALSDYIPVLESSAV